MNQNDVCYSMKLDPAAKLPTRATQESAGLDFYSLEEKILEPGKTYLLRTGVTCKVPEGKVGILKDRSSFGSKALHILAGVIDSDYTGEIKVVMINLSSNEYFLKSGEKFAQMIIVEAAKPSVLEVTEMPVTERNDKGFGSSNTK